jgi:anti-sigma B factor antagonist
MHILEDRIDDIFIFCLDVDMFGDTRIQHLSKRIRQVLENGVRKIIFDFKYVKAINSIGIGILMSCWTSVKREGGFLKLTGLNEKIRTILEVTDLDQFFEIHPDTKHAMDSYQSKDPHHGRI